MTFDVAAESYDRFMGRFAAPLAPLLADAADVGAGQTALDVGCGPGALTRELVARLGAGAVTALDPSEEFVAAARGRLPGVRVLAGVAEDIPLADRAGSYVGGLDGAHRAALREHCREALAPGGFAVEALAWSVTARPS